jgi:hypothetical protein
MGRYGARVSNDNITRIGPGVPVRQEKKTRRWFGIKPEFVIAAAVIIAMGMMITAVAVSGTFDRSPAGTFMIAGRVRVSGSGSNLAFGNSVGDCRGKAGFDDLHEGAQVVVADAGGKTIAIGQLGLGESATTDNGITGSVVRLVACTFPIEVRDVPEGQAFYRITVTHRGTQEYTRGQLRQPIHLTLG